MTASELATFAVSIDANGILSASLDVPDIGVALADLELLIERLRRDPSLKGMVLTSGRSKGDFAGADLKAVDAPNAGRMPAGEAGVRAELDAVAALGKTLRSLETCGKPVAAAIDGSALGTWFELLLATHYRVAGNSDRVVLGLPEIASGSIPRAGATQRLPRLIGIEKALPLLLEGKTLGAREAVQLGLLDALVDSGRELEAARAWILAGGQGSQPWDRKAFRMPGGGPYEGNAMLIANASVRRHPASNHPAMLNLLKCVYEGSMTPIDVGMRIEAKYFLLTRNPARFS